MMTLLTTLHRWTGAVLGLLLALFGLSGTLLLWKPSWAGVPQVAAPLPDAAIARLAAAAQALGATGVTLPSAHFGVAQARFGREGGAYLAPDGSIIDRWQGSSGRVETWLFDLHHHLLLGELGDVIGGVVALIGLGFLVTGAILWWRTRRSFEARLLPRRLSRPAIIRHHRDLGILALPVLLVTFATGAMMGLKPVGEAVANALSPAAVNKAATAPPKAKGGPLPAAADWPAMIAATRAVFPAGELRAVLLPRKPGDLVQVRVRQPGEWHPDGRSGAWFDAATARLVAQRYAGDAPLGVRARNAAYPLHAGVLGLPFRLLMTAAGLALTLLGSLAVFSFWRLRLAVPAQPQAA